MAAAPPISPTEMGSELAETGTVPSYTGPASGAVPRLPPPEESHPAVPACILRAKALESRDSAFPL